MDGQTVEVRFKGTRKAYFVWTQADAPLRVNDCVVVEAERGRDLGRVTAVGDVAAKKCGSGCSGCAVGETAQPEPLRPVVRRATDEDVRSHEESRASEEDVRRQVMQRVRAHELIMKISDTEWQWDRSKLTIYFTAEKRVDFRTLVRDLASRFRTRIELRQIGVRDEAARLTGVGRCGREYCCSTWLKELSPVNLGLAKDQHLSLNPSQISGGCGRLLCCLKYEHEFYVSSRKRFPKEGKSLQTSAGTEKVIAVDIFRERVYLRGEGKPSRIIPLIQLREEMAAAQAEAPALAAAPASAPTRVPRVPGVERGPTSATPSPAGPAPAEAEQSRRRRRRRGPRGGNRSGDNTPGDNGPGEPTE